MGHSDKNKLQTIHVSLELFFSPDIFLELRLKNRCIFRAFSSKSTSFLCFFFKIDLFFEIFLKVDVFLEIFLKIDVFLEGFLRIDVFLVLFLKNRRLKVAKRRQ